MVSAVYRPSVCLPVCLSVSACPSVPHIRRYLKCEMYNPQYTTRFGVILEAYLKGCGEAMLVREL